ncbi:hypothetical protein T265_07467 [Opisthorchis viverrini]|uniref:Uncharacterized protein n=1 Tax=Opisthorchis viverrini TaxID=6198 RepID=A0A074ZCQ9_OPIVI|nr:hypothetical protein T265_07467 [Opisthorchis viverrini]KER24958.1 hypothetical protein T265_07467 [Opisthorchis viverrini]
MATERLAEPDVRRTYMNCLLESLSSDPTSDVNSYWDEITTSSRSAENFACGTVHPGSLKHWISDRTVALLKSRRNIPVGPEHSSMRGAIRRQGKKTKEMEEAQKAGNARRLFQLIRVTGPRKPPHVEPDDVIDIDVSFKLSKRLRRQRRKIQKKRERLQFAAACEDALVCREQPTLVDLPATIHNVQLDANLLTSLSVLVTGYLDAFEAGDLRKRLIDFYVPDAYLTLQITPYLGIHDDMQNVPTKREKLKAQPSWAEYERFAVNLIPGAVPLPAWAWASLCTAVATGPKSEQGRLKLGKHDRQRLKVLRAFQAAHSQRLKNVSRSASSASDRWLESVPLPPLARREASGHADIQGLLSRLPDLIHVKADECCCLDVISAEVCSFHCVSSYQIDHSHLLSILLPSS